MRARPACVLLLWVKSRGLSAVFWRGEERERERVWRNEHRLPSRRRLRHARAPMRQTVGSSSRQGHSLCAQRNRRRLLRSAQKRTSVADRSRQLSPVNAPPGSAHTMPIDQAHGKSVDVDDDPCAREQEAQPPHTASQKSAVCAKCVSARAATAALALCQNAHNTDDCFKQLARSRSTQTRRALADRRTTTRLVTHLFCEQRRARVLRPCSLSISAAGRV